MKKTIAVMCMTLACSAGGGVFAQMPKDQMSGKPMAKDGAMTVSGCVAAGKDGMGFMLNNAMTVGGMEKPMDKDHMKTPGASGGHMMSYELVGGENLRAHLGHKVELTGTMSSIDMERMGKMGKMDPMAKDKTMSNTDMKSLKLNVTSMKMISATCP